MSSAKARTTYYKGIIMRSRLEASYAEALDRGGFAWKYEPYVFASPSGQWLPDFVVSLDACEVYVEVKSASWLHRDNKADINRLLDRMSSLWLTCKDAVAFIDFVDYPAAELSRSTIGRKSDVGAWWLHDPSLPLPLVWPDARVLASTGEQ